VTTRVGGSPEVVVDGDTGILVEPASPQLMADAIKAFVQRPDFARSAVEKGRRRVEELFDVRRMVSQYESLYRACARRCRCNRTEGEGQRASDIRLGEF